MLRKLTEAGLVFALLTGTASAQKLGAVPPLPSDNHPPTRQEIEAKKEADRAYKSAVEKIPEKKPVDPWGDVRPAPSPGTKNKQQ